jgi:hypothetical protein
MASPRIRVILAYFGRLPETFPLWLLSASRCRGIEWLLVTDDATPLDYPDNVTVARMPWGDLCDRIRGRIDIGRPVKLDGGWDLCALKPAYGEIFADMLEGYDWWGYCDPDVIFGDIGSFLPPAVLETHDKILWLGHLSLCRNTPAMTGGFRLPTAAGAVLYREAFSGGVLCFDEVAFNDMLETAGKRIWKELVFADFKHRSFLFRDHEHQDLRSSARGRQVFTWEDGTLLRHFLDDATGSLRRQPLMYAHFCRRPMRIDLPPGPLPTRFAMIPNRFVPHPGAVTAEWIRDHTVDRIHWDYWLPRLQPGRIVRKIRNMLGPPSNSI